MPNQFHFDLKRFETGIVKSLYKHLGETTAFIRSVHLAVVNFDPNNIRDGSVLPSILSISKTEPEGITQNKLSQELFPETESMANRFAVIGMISATEDFIRQCWLPLRVIQKLKEKSEKLLYSDWKAVWPDEYKAIRTHTFGQLISEIPDQIRKLQPTLLPEDWEVQNKLMKYNKFRNCIAHRLGYVRETDIEKSSDSLTIECRGLYLYLGADPILGFPFKMEKGNTISGKIEDKVKSWKLGERIDIKTEDTQNIGFDLFFTFQKFIDPLFKTTYEISKEKK